MLRIDVAVGPRSANRSAAAVRMAATTSSRPSGAVASLTSPPGMRPRYRSNGASMAVIDFPASLADQENGEGGALVRPPE